MITASRCAKCGAEQAAFAVEGFCSACLLEAGFAAPARDAPSVPRRFGNYVLLEEIARGGMGVVYKARQLGLDRLVAVKMILSGQFAGEQEARRFRAEAQAAAMLQHPGMVAIYEVGEQEGQLFFSMEYVEGRSFAELVRTGPLPPGAAARYVRAIAETIHYAHEHGILHRDLKPSNVLLDLHDQPRVTDFGLAKRLPSPRGETASSELTLTGEVLGSPNFMPPEQALGKGSQLSPASDVYSIGGLLYHLITGRAPFLADSVPATLRLVAETDPIAPRLLQPAIPLDLETICLRCLEKDPARRYASAQELADELGRILRDEPIRARPVGSMEKFWRWRRRHRALAGLAAVVGLLLVAIAVGSTLAAVSLQKANQAARQGLWDSFLAQARANRWSGRVGRRFGSLEVLRRAVAIRPSIELRNEAIACLALPDLYPESGFDLPEGDVFLGQHLDDQKWLGVGPAGELSLRRLSDGRALRRVGQVSLPFLFGRMSRDERFAALASAEVKYAGGHAYVAPGSPKPEVQIIDLSSVGDAWHITNLWAHGAAFSVDNGLVFLAHDQGEGRTGLTAYDRASRRALYTTPLWSSAEEMSISPGNDRLAISCWTSLNVALLDPTSGRTLSTLVHSNGTAGLAWHPREKVLATGDRDGRIYLWDLSSDAPELQFLDHGAVATGVQFSPDGEILATTGWNDQLRLWDFRTRMELVRKPNFGSVSFLKTADALRIVCHPSPRRIEVCSFANGAECTALLLPKGVLGGSHCAFSPDGRLLASSHLDGVRLWDLARGKECGFLAEGEVASAEFDRMGARLFTCGHTEFNVWSIQRCETNSELRLGVSFSETYAEGREIERAHLDAAAGRATFASDGWVEVADLSAGRRLLPRWREEMPDRLLSPALSPDGRFCAAPAWSGRQAFVWDLESEQPCHRLSGSGVTFTAFSPDGRLLIIGSTEQYQALDSHTWQERWKISRQSTGGRHARVNLSPDGIVGAATVSLTGIRLFDVGDGHELATLESPDPDAISWFSFSPDGGRLAVITSGPLMRVWDLHLLREQLARMKLDDGLPRWPAPPTNGWKLSMNVKSVTTRVPPRAASRASNCPPAEIDLTKHYTSTFDNFALMTGESGNDLAPLATGQQVLAGTGFDVRGVVQLLGVKGYGGRGVLRPEARDIRVGRPCQALEFLHACLDALPDEGKVGEYVIHYADGGSEVIPLKTGENIADWWEHAGEARPVGADTVVAWRGANAASQHLANHIVLYKFRWVNPRGDVSIATLDFRSTLTGSAPFLVALTAE